MKILYGVQGTGNGHTTRARVMAKAFSQRADAKVDYLFSGRDPDKYFDMDIFADYQVRGGLTFVHQQGAIDKWGTAKAIRPLQFIRDVKALDLSGYDLIINDFEPVSAWAARRQGVPCLSISHQASFRHPVPKSGDNIGNRLLLDYFAPSDIQLGVHWYHFGHPIMPPFIEDEYVEGLDEKHVLVYLPFEALEDIAQLLEPLSEENFLVYHPDIINDHVQANIHWRVPCKKGFHQDLHHAKGVIANGGFELSSECLKLGKKLLIKPLHGQFEQLSNVITLEQLDLCKSMTTLDTEEVEGWLELPGAEPIHFPNDPQLLVDWLLHGNWQDVKSICHSLWQQVSFPEKLKRRLSEYPDLE
ncbi:glycosyltransferase family protein [Aliiglaciecola sp. CAU 1673]|uniref:MJ1255/VC2487 family glycosyltransferase n=1 Tax=Aliiglaciecola sp. CAU 1673 TaxID=3032595 RepID=UPI0023D9B639|nr:MJ1255/VC2487 family glycosyltransferase [Aliiglaciecola sp. CAU 1673]MDF2179196.1 glycosyltransferase family protein [Aliiglaciecola sp. CAU 1673]